MAHGEIMALIERSSICRKYGIAHQASASSRNGENHQRRRNGMALARNGMAANQHRRSSLA